jgi:hypothetical protein
MAIVALTQPYTMKNATFAVAADNYETALTGVTFNPTAGGIVQLINGSQISGDASWVCQLGTVQDLAPTGLTRYLMDHEGEELAVTFVPELEGPTVNATLTITPGTFGGAADNNPKQAQVNLPVKGKPTFTDPTP